MRVELFYFDGCPSYSKALDNLLMALALERVSVEVELIRVRDASDAAAKSFIGSPTIRINGSDVDEGAAATVQPGKWRGCRLYVDGDRSLGWPPVERIRDAIRGAMARN